MSKGALISVLGLMLAFLPFIGFPLVVKTMIAVIGGLLLTGLGFLVRQERLWLLRALSSEHKTDAYTENRVPYKEIASREV